MDDNRAALMLPAPSAVVLADAPPRPSLTRFWAIAQVILICGVPTQLVAGTVLALGAQMPILDANGVSFEFVATASLLDTALVCVLIRMFLTMSGEDSEGVFVGTRPVRGEVLRGLLCLPVIFAVVTGTVAALRFAAPWTHTVKSSPFEAFIQNPLDTAIFLVVVVLAGGVREELQRAFILHRFDQRLGGIRVGLVLFTLAFGAFHAADQGIDVAIAVGMVGLFWGVLYMRRRSVVMAMTNHAGFNAAQILYAVFAKSVGA